MVKIRLRRKGRKKQPVYDIVVANATAPRDGKFIDLIGKYHPLSQPSGVSLDEDKAFKWVMNGAQPTNTVRSILSQRGVMMKKHLQLGVQKGAISQEKADEKLQHWLDEKAKKLEAKKDEFAKARAEELKQRLEMEKKVSEARAEAVRQKKGEQEAVAEEESAQGESGEKDNDSSSGEETNNQIQSNEDQTGVSEGEDKAVSSENKDTSSTEEEKNS